jgi:exodeoxyribonuclease VII small subunit
MSLLPESDAAGADPTRDEQKNLSFAEMLEQLEEIVKHLESGELSLEESLAKFEEGVRLARTLESILSRAESRVQEILKKSDETVDSQTEEPDDFIDVSEAT